MPYDLNSALFSDYAFKLRALYVPAGKTVGYNADGTLDFPIGTAIARVATRSVPGAILVGGAMIAKTLYDRSKGRRAAQAEGEAKLTEIAAKGRREP